jgi:hypothetical protein
MGGEGNCCRDECCGNPLTPNGWILTDCCSECYEAITEDWTVECSDVIREDNRSASCTYEVYARLYPVLSGGSLTVMPPCVMDPPPATTCHYEDGNGNPLPTCEETETLCTSIEEVNSVDTVYKIVARWKRIGMSTTIARVLTQCDSEVEATCKWVVVSRLLVRIQYAQVAFIDRTHTITGSSACCSDWSLTDNATAPTCEERAAMGLANDITIPLVRAKYYTSEPTGVITFSPGDTIDCAPLLDPCCSIGDDDATIVSSDPGAIPWTAPSCEDFDVAADCNVLFHFADPLNDPPTDECFWQVNGTITRHLKTMVGDLLGVPAVEYECESTCGTDPPKNFLDGYISAVECVDLTSSHTDSGYTPRSVVIDYPAWTVDLDGGCA